MNEHHSDSMHRAEQTPTTQPADEAVTALTDEELEQAAGGGEAFFCHICGALKGSFMNALPTDKCPNKECPSNKLAGQLELNQNDYVVQTPSLPPL